MKFFQILTSLSIVLFLSACGTTTGGTDASEETLEEPEFVSIFEDQLDVKEFFINSFTGSNDGQPAPQFSVKEIQVDKGDKVRIKINTISGRHDFHIDEVNVHEETPTGAVTTVEFIADQAGTFEYYCAKPRHRELGHWGTIIVNE